MGAKQSTTDTPSDDAALREIVEGVESETGDRFFYSLVKHLASALGCEYAFVSELVVDRLRFRTRAVWGRGSFMDNFEVPLDGTPCQAVLNGESSHHPERICQLFPTDAALKQWGVESYCGVACLIPAEPSSATSLSCPSSQCGMGLADSRSCEYLRRERAPNWSVCAPRMRCAM